MLEDLAQEFAESTARIVGYDVVLTDTAGRIIGSSRKERLGDWLIEAPEVVRSRERHVVTPEEAERVSHTKPGVSYPLMDSWGKVLGTVAITGLPEEVVPFAPLVKTYAELFLRERTHIRESLSLEADLQGVFRALISEDFSPAVVSWLTRKTRLIGLDPGRFHVGVALKIHRPEAVSLPSEARGTVQTWFVLQTVRERLNAGKDFAVSLDNERYGLILSRHDPGMEGWREAVSGRISSIRSYLGTLGLETLVVAGDPGTGLEAMGRSLRESFGILEVAETRGRKEGLYWVEENRLELLLLSLPPVERADFVEEELGKLRDLSYGPDLEVTLKTWLESGFSYRKTAQILSIHRNTLHYRLDKAKEILGRDPRCPREMVTLYLALKMPVKD